MLFTLVETIKIIIYIGKFHTLFEILTEICTEAVIVFFTFKDESIKF